MASPKPTYYPIYLQQKGKNGYIDSNYVTMLSNNAQLKGRKMYPVRKKLSEFNIPMGQEKNSNPANPLDEGSEFLLKIRYHNLKRVELGALLSAIELRSGYCHSIGAFKPYGYGACTYTITSELPDKEILKNEFLQLMETKIENYSKSKQLNELWTMLNPRKAEHLKSPLKYMNLKDFVDCKRNNPNKQNYGKYLSWYSELVFIPQSVAKQKKKDEFSQARVTVISRITKQAELIEGKNANKSYKLVVEGKKLKIGDIIKVKIIRNKTGNIDYFEYKE